MGAVADAIYGGGAGDTNGLFTDLAVAGSMIGLLAILCFVARLSDPHFRQMDKERLSRWLKAR